jgi:hypothetical protein
MVLLPPIQVHSFEVVEFACWLLSRVAAVSGLLDAALPGKGAAAGAAWPRAAEPMKASERTIGSWFAILEGIENLL